MTAERPLTPTAYIEFQALSGNQGGRTQCVTIWSLDLLLRLTNDPVVRQLAHSPPAVDDRFVRYLVKRLRDGADARTTQPYLIGVFDKVMITPNAGANGFVTLRIDANARIEILDGLHRLVALRQAGLSAAVLRAQTAPVLITSLQSPEEFESCRAAIATRSRPLWRRAGRRR